MNKLLISLFACASLSAFAQTSTITAATATVTNSVTPPSTAPFLSSPIVDFLSHSNLMMAIYPIYDSKTHNFGGGIGFGYKLSDFLVTTLRFDEINGRIWSPSASIQLQLPIHVLGKFDVIPLVYDGIATPLTGKNSFDPINIAGVGGAIEFHSTHWYVPAGIIADYERWTGGGMNDNQFRIGPFWKF